MFHYFKENPIALVDETTLTPQKNKILITKEQWGPTFEIGLEIFINSFSRVGWKDESVFHFIQSDRCCGMGNLIPAFNIAGSETSKPLFRICFTDGHKSTRRCDDKFIPIQEWIVLNISQYFANVCA